MTETIRLEIPRWASSACIQVRYPDNSTCRFPDKAIHNLVEWLERKEAEGCEILSVTFERQSVAQAAATERARRGYVGD